MPDIPRWPRWVPRTTVVWWFAGAVVALLFALTGRDLPVGASTRDAAGTIVGDVQSDALTTGLAALALLGAAHAAWMTGRSERASTRRPSTGFVRAAAVTLTALIAAAGVLFTDSSLLARLGYVPLVLVRAPFDPVFARAVGEYVAPGFLLQLGLLVALVLLAVTTILFVRRGRGACEVCGRGDASADHVDLHDHSATRRAPGTRATASGLVAWGRPAAIVAAIIPCLYALTRLAWVLGYPLGLDPDMYADMKAADELLIPALGLGMAAAVGAVLTLGLVQRWGEVFPRWVPGLAGRRVPVPLAVVPASVVAVAILPAGLSMIKGAVASPLSEAGIGWAVFGPGLLWPLWSVALGIATWAYAERRRGTCRACGRTGTDVSGRSAG